MAIKEAFITVISGTNYSKDWTSFIVASENSIVEVNTLDYYWIIIIIMVSCISDWYFNVMGAVTESFKSFIVVFTEESINLSLKMW